MGLLPKILSNSQKIKLDRHTFEVAKNSTASIIVKVIGMAIGFGLSVFLGRTIGAEGLGIINLSDRIVNILLIVGLLGMRQVIIKEVAIAYQRKDPNHIGNIMHTAYWLNGGITISLSFIIILISPWLANNVFHEPRLTYPLMIALVVMTPQVFSRIFSSALVGFGKIWQSNLVEQTLSVAITGVLILLLIATEREISVLFVAATFALGRIGVSILVGFYWRSLFSHKSKSRLLIRSLSETSLPLFLSTLASTIISNTDTVLLGSFGNASDVGLYTVALRVALLTSVFLQITNSAVSPKIASLFEAGRTLELEKMLQRVTLFLFVIGVISVATFVVFGKQVLSLWGSEFVVSYNLLLILSLGQLVNIGSGAVSLLLVMTGFHKKDTQISVCFMIFNLIASVFLIKALGALGAAIASSSTIAGMNIFRIIVAKRRTGISTIGLIIPYKNNKSR